MIIHKDSDDFRLNRLRPILLFDIEENIHNKHMGRVAMRKSEELNALTPQKYGIRKEKAADIHALNTHLFYYLIILK